MSNVYIPTIAEVLSLTVQNQLRSDIEKLVGVTVADCCITAPVNSGDACFWYGHGSLGWLNHTRLVDGNSEYVGGTSAGRIYMLQRVIDHCGHKMTPETLAVFEKALAVLALRAL